MGMQICSSGPANLTATNEAHLAAEPPNNGPAINSSAASQSDPVNKPNGNATLAHRLRSVLSDKITVGQLLNVRDHLLDNLGSHQPGNAFGALNELGVFCPVDPEADITRSIFQKNEEYALLARTLMKKGRHVAGTQDSATSSQEIPDTRSSFGNERRLLNDNIPGLKILHTPGTLIDPKVKVSLYSHRYPWIGQDAEYDSMPSVMYAACMKPATDMVGKIDTFKKSFGQVTSVTSNEGFDEKFAVEVESRRNSHAELMEKFEERLSEKGNHKKYTDRYPGFARSLHKMKERLSDYQAFREQAIPQPGDKVTKGKIYPDGALCDNEVMARIWLWDAVAVDIGKDTRQGLVATIELQMARKALAVELRTEGVNHRLFKDFVLQQLSVGDDGRALSNAETMSRYNTLTEADKKEVLAQLVQRLNAPVSICRYAPAKSDIEGVGDVSIPDVVQAIDAVLHSRLGHESPAFNKPGRIPGKTASAPPSPVLAPSQLSLTRTTRSRSVGYAGEPDHDEMFNNKAKVAFESALGTIFFRRQELLSPVVDKTTENIKDVILPVLEKVLAHKKNKDAPAPTPAEKALFKCFSESRNARTAYQAYLNGTTGQYPLTEAAPKPKTAEEIESLVNYYKFHVFGKNGDPATLLERWTAIRDLGDFIRRPSNFSDGELPLEEVHFIDAQKRARIEDRIKDYTDIERHGIPGLFSPEPPHASESRAKRLTRQADRHNNIGTHAGIWTVKKLSEDSKQTATNPSSGLLSDDQLMPPVYSISGVGVWQPRIAPARMHPSANARENDKRGSDLENREKDFAYQAMYELDMPGIGGASGGSGGDLLVTEIFGGITDPEDLQKAAFCSSMEMVRNGYHAFHEAATIARLFGAQYTPGNYASAIPQSWVNALPELKQLQEQFPHLLKYETP